MERIPQANKGMAASEGDIKCGGDQEATLEEHISLKFIVQEDWIGCGKAYLSILTAWKGSDFIPNASTIFLVI